MVHTAQVWYSAGSWKKPVWYTLAYNALCDEVIAQLEKYSGIQTTSDHVCVPGMDIITCPLKTFIENLEKT